MEEDSQNVLGFANVQGRKVEADFEGGAVTSDGGALFLRVVEAGIGVIRRLVRAVRDRRHASYIDHTMKDLISQRVYQIACGYEDANDADTLRVDPGFKTACERLPLSGPDLASQPTLTRLGKQCLPDRSCAHGRRPGRRLCGLLPNAAGESHLWMWTTPMTPPMGGQLLAWLAQAQALSREQGKKVRLFTAFSYQASSWSPPRRVVAKVEASARGDNVRFVTTSLGSSQPSFIYDRIYSARGRMEGFIKNHKTFLSSDRTSCHSFEANQFRLFLHSAAYMLLHALAEKALQATQWEHAYFDTLQKRLLKVGARVEELRTKVKFHFPLFLFAQAGIWIYAGPVAGRLDVTADSIRP